jgi:hypothetical protein
MTALAWAGGPTEEFDPLQIEVVNDHTVEYSFEPDGTLVAHVTNAAGETHIHAIGTRGFWGYVKNHGSAADANVAINLRWSGTDRTTQDVNSCSTCGFYYKFCSVEGSYHMMSSLETNGGHAPLTSHGYRCADDLIRQDFNFDVWIFYMKVCNPIGETE